MSSKKCTNCEIEKSLDNFYKRGSGYKSHCKECSSIYGKKRYVIHKETHNKKMSEHYVENKEKYKNKQKEYREENRDKINLVAKEYTKERRKTDILFKIKHNLRVRIKEYMKSKNIKKSNKTFDFVGCTPDLLRKHLESNFKEGMTWNNYGEWEIDHKIPLCLGTTISELYKLNYYRNLQPMWKHDNIKKGAKLDF